VIEPAYFGALAFFALLGFIHSMDTTYAGGREWRSAPVTPALLLLSGALLFAALLVPVLGIVLAGVFEPPPTQMHFTSSGNGTTITIATHYPVSTDQVSISWWFWVEVAALIVGVPGSYYFGYNLGFYLQEKRWIPLFVSLPTVVIEIPPSEEYRLIRISKKTKSEEEEEISLARVLGL